MRASISIFVAATAGILASISSTTASAQTVIGFDGVVIASCTLAVSRTGTLTMNTTGTELGSENTSGSSAVLSVVSTGGTPSIVFTAPTMANKPAAYTGNPTLNLKYSSPGGANQAYTTSSSQYTSTNPLGDTVTLDAKATDSSGFVAGSYRVQATATCQQ